MLSDKIPSYDLMAFDNLITRIDNNPTENVVGFGSIQYFSAMTDSYYHQSRL